MQNNQTLYMLIQHYTSPSKITKNNMIITERVSIVNNVNDDEWKTSLIIIDLLNSNVLKNRTTEHSDDIIKKYYSKYHKEIVDYISDWASRDKNNLDIMKSFINSPNLDKTHE